MTERKIHLCLAHMSGEEEKYIHEAFDTNWVTSLGPNVDAFERELEHYIGMDKHITTVSSGTAAIHLGLVLLGVGRDDEVICQSWTFSASANPIVYLGATPIFVDSETETWNMSPDLLETAIRDRINITGRKPKAIIIVHMYGMPAQMDAIMEIASRYEIPILEDSAEALGSRYKCQLCGTFGDLAVLSFNGNKMITTSSGGALICPTVEVKKRALFYATQAREPFPYYQHEHIGYNYRMSNIAAGIGLGQMIVLDSHIAHHRKVSKLYAKLFAEVDGIKVHLNPSVEIDSNYWLSAIVIDHNKTGVTSEMIRQHLESCNIESRPLWKPMHLQPVFKDTPCYVSGVSETIFPHGLCLPSGPCVCEEDVNLIVDEIKACIATNNKR